jgi:hypothetical protein
MTRGWNPWSMAALGLVLVMATALVAGLVVANWSGSILEPEPRKQAPAASRPWQATRTVSVKPAASPIARSIPVAVAIPAEAVQACNQRAADEVGEPERAEDAVRDSARGGVAAVGGGTLYGLNESRRDDEKYRAAYASCMRARGYVAG